MSHQATLTMVEMLPNILLLVRLLPSTHSLSSAHMGGKKSLLPYNTDDVPQRPGLQTRARNKDKRVGLIDAPKKRRTPAQKKADNEKAEQEKLAMEIRTAEIIRDIKLRARKRAEEHAAEITPPPKLSKEKLKRLRYEWTHPSPPLPDVVDQLSNHEDESGAEEGRELEYHEGSEPPSPLDRTIRKKSKRMKEIRDTMDAVNLFEVDDDEVIQITSKVSTSCLSEYSTSTKLS